MKALTFQDIRDIRYREVPDPLIVSPTDVIVKISHSAVCGSDLHVYHGRETGIDTGTVMGHEFVGEIIETGSGVRNFGRGDQVISPFTTSCGECYFCRNGLTARCIHGQLFGWVENGNGLQGVQAEYVRVPLADSTLVKYPGHISPEKAMLAGDILSTGYYCADMAEVNRDGSYAVLGCGPVGLLAIMSAIEMGAVKIWAIDSIPYRLEAAGSLGAEPVNLKNGSPLEEIMNSTKGVGVDAVMEAVGSHEATKLAYDLVRPGGIISTVGVHTDHQFAFSPVQAYDKNITFKIGRCPARFYMEKLLKKMEEGKFDLERILTHRYPLSAGKKAYKVFDRKEDDCLKIILET